MNTNYVTHSMDNIQNEQKRRYERDVKEKLGKIKMYRPINN